MSLLEQLIAFLYSNKLSERGIKKTPFTTASKSITYLGINLAKEVKDLYTKNDDNDDKNSRRHKEMEKYSVLMEWKNSYH